MKELDQMRTEMKELKYNIFEDECLNNYNCKNCGNIEECYWEAISRENSSYAESLDYGGYDSEEEFWDQTFKF